MLVLDEKKIRKGKPISLPYQGSKGKICKQIVEIIKQNFGTDKTIYDVFGGGGAITYECILNGLVVVYNDFNTYITEVHKNLKTYPKEKLIDLMISRDEFQRIRQLPEKTWLDEFKLLLNSFGNKKRTYMYNKVYSDFKYNLSLDIYKQHGFENYKQSDLFLNASKEYDEKYRLKDESRFGYNQIEIIGRLNRVYSVIDKNVNFTIKNEDYRYFSDVENSILYLDPPYENSTVEGYEGTGDFDSQAFYDWAYEMSKKNVVIISSYTVSDDRFDVVYEFEKARSTLNVNGAGECEKLFMVTKLQERFLKKPPVYDFFDIV